MSSSIALVTGASRETGLGVEVAHRYGVQASMVHGHPKVGEVMPEMTRRLQPGELAAPDSSAECPLAQASEARAAFEQPAPRGRIVLVC